MPYDDSNIKKMIHDQLERKVAFSRSKIVSLEVKDLIRHILEVNVALRYNLTEIMAHPWLSQSGLSCIPGPSGAISEQGQLSSHGEVGQQEDRGKPLPPRAKRKENGVEKSCDDSTHVALA